MSRGWHFINNTDIGQNFLVDRSVVDWMVKRAGLSAADKVLEIGPGDGALTKGLLEAGCEVCTIELDARLKRFLDPIAVRHANLTMLWGDAVQFDYENGLPWLPTKIIANLPYHITTPILWVFLEKLASRGLNYLLLMVQMEAAERMTALAHNHERSPLGVTIEAMGQAQIVRKVPASAFHPQPRVNSSLIEIKLDKNFTLACDPAWRAFLARSFAQRRKTLVNNWCFGYGSLTRERAQEILTRHGLGLSARAEELTLADWTSLVKEPEFAAAAQKAQESE